jgi:hypothetical protein
MTDYLKTLKAHKVLFLNILFTLFCITFPLSAGIKAAWFLMWFLIPLILPTNQSISCIVYMSLYMRVQPNVKLFSIIVCASVFIVLIKEILYLNKNKLLQKYFKIFTFYLFLLILPLFYSVFVNKSINISFIYYLNMINLLFLFYLIKNK